MAVRDIGRKSLLRSSIGLVLGIGITSATFYCKGTRAWEIESLNIDATGVTSSMENRFRSQFGILSGPDASIGLTFSKRRSTDATGMHNSHGSSSATLSRSEIGSISLLTSTNASLIAFGRSVPPIYDHQ